MNRPRLYLHPDRKYLSIGFDETPDTLLHIGDLGWRDVERVERWCDAICDLIDGVRVEAKP